MKVKKLYVNISCDAFVCNVLETQGLEVRSDYPYTPIICGVPFWEL